MSPCAARSRPGPLYLALPFCAYVGSVFLVAGVASYPVHRLVSLATLSGAPFHQVTFRLLELCALLGLVPLLRYLGLRGLCPWGYRDPGRRFMRAVLAGLAAGIGSLAALVVLLVALGVREPRPELAWSLGGVATTVAGALLAGALVAVIEETWFRGALHSAIACQGDARVAVAVTALLYSAVHFVRADVPLDASELRWWSGFVVIADSFHRFAQPAVIDSMLALVAAGVWLGIVRHQSGVIAACIGIHAGWAVVIGVTRAASRLNPESRWAFLVGDFDGVIGLAALCWFSLCAWACYGLRASRR